jgi:hypothetical protein
MTGLCRHRREAEVQLQPIRSQVLEEGEWSVSSSGRLTPGEIRCIHYTGGWMGHWASLDYTENLVSSGFDPQTFQPVASRYSD